MPTDVTSLLKRWSRLKAEHQQWESLWQEVGDFIHPRRSNFSRQRNQGQKQTEFLFDSTALDAHDRLAATLNGTLTSRATEWFSLKMRDEQFADNGEVKQWLEDCTKRMFHAINQSNFAQEAHELYLDETAFGTGGLFVEERNPNKPAFGGFVFTAIDLATFSIEEDPEGRVNAVFRTFKMTATNIVTKWGDGKVGEKVQAAFDNGKGDTEFEILHAVYPRLAGAKANPQAGTPKTKLPWASCYVCVSDKYILAEGGFHEFPFMVPRWSKSTGEKYGRGPGHLALPDVKTLNKAKEIGLKTWAKALDMPTKSMDDGVVMPIRNVPGGNTVVRNMEFLQPLYPPGTFRDAIGGDQIKVADLQASIKRIFYADLTELPDKNYMTAFEVGKQYELLQRKLGPTMGRQESEFLAPLIDRLFAIMLRHGALPQAPAVLTQSDGAIDVQYEGPLAKSQRLGEVEGMERLTQTLATAAQLDPSVLDVVDFDEVIRIEADILGVPEGIIRDPDAVAKLRQQKQQQLQDQQVKNDLAMAAESAGKAAPALKLMQPGGATGAAA